MKNITLIGMSGAGKSTVGVLLAKALNYKFVDTDLLLQQQENGTLHEIIQAKGLKLFKQLEGNLISGLCLDHTVISTGGSVVYYPDAMAHLKTMSYIVYLNVGYEEILERIGDFKERGIVIEKDKTFKDVYDERMVLYEKYADCIVDIGTETVEETVKKTVERLKNSGL